MKLTFFRTKAGWLGMTGILLLVAGGAGLLAQKPRMEKVFALDEGHSYLGIKMDDVTSENAATYSLSAERGAIVRMIDIGSPAEKAGLQEKDVILEYAGTQVMSTMQLGRLVRETPPGRKVDLAVSRGGKKVSLSVTIGKREGEWKFGDGRKSIVVPGPDSQGEFHFDGPRGRIFKFEGPGGGPFAFTFPKGEFFSVLDGKPRLGITLQPLTDQLGEYFGVPGRKGALVTAVSEGSAAAAAKVKAGDVIIKADDNSVKDPEDLMHAIQRKDLGDRVELRIIRDKKEIAVVVELPKETRKTGGYRL